jgi:threonine dehydrogenase-like Zn-dependent dehydrogenase
VRGLVFEGGRQVALRDFPDPTPGPGEVVVEMRASGICGSDLNLYRKPSFARPIICGHEPCGVVVARGPGLAEQAPIGQRVMIHHYRGCGQCWLCRMGYTQMCRAAEVMGTDIHGGNARYLLAPVSTLVELPAELTFVAGSAISCGTGTAYAALKRLDVSGRDTLAIFGQGPVGLAATQLAAAMGARVIALDPEPERRAMAASLGAAETLDPARADAVAEIRQRTHGEGADATLDCSGNSQARTDCARAARPWGRACYVGAHGTATFEMTPDVIHRQLTMYGCWTFNPLLMAECAQFAVDRQVPLEAVFTDRFGLDQAAEAFARVEGRQMGKGVFVFD